MRVSGRALAAGLIAGSPMLLTGAATAEAQSAPDSMSGGHAGRIGTQGKLQSKQQRAALSREENAAVRPLMNAVQAHDWVAASAALGAAQAGVRSPAGRYVVGQLMLEIGRGQPNEAMQRQAVDAMVYSGGAPDEVLPMLLQAQIGFALRANEFQAAEAALTRFIELQPNDAVRLEQLAQVKVRLNKRQEAFGLFRRVARLAEAGGQHAAEPVYREMLAVAYDAHMVAEGLDLSLTLLTHYPTEANWRTALGVYRDLVAPHGGAELDLYRLMRTAGSLTSERDYYVYAEAARAAGLPGEAKTVLEEGLGRHVLQGVAAEAQQMLAGVSAQVVDDRASLAGARTQALAAADGRAAWRTADAYYGYGQYADAAELYRTALRKGGVDAGLVNLRLGAALAGAGQRAEAEAAFRAVTSGNEVTSFNNAELARLWLLWLSQHPA